MNRSRFREMNAVTYSAGFLHQTSRIAEMIDVDAIEEMARRLVELRESRGRLFLLGVGGGAGHASHAACDFRKVAGIEAYAPTDNVSELTARVNDEGWETTFESWLRVSRLGPDDMVLVFSVGGGDLERNISPNLVRALELAQEVGATICGVVGRDGGHTARVAHTCVVVPSVDPDSVTAQTEAFQAVVWHLLVSHPLLRANQMKWESVP